MDVANQFKWKMETQENQTFLSISHSVVSGKVQYVD